MRLQSASACRIAIAVLAATCSLAVLPAAAPAAVHRADGSIGDWRGDATMLSGQTRVSRGELIHDDWLYDDYGANLDGGPNTPAFRAALAPTRGDYRYPTNSNRYGYNAADLRQLRVAADGAGLHVVAFLQTLKDRDAPIVTLAIDSGRSRDASAWPDGAGLDGPAADHFVTFSGGFADVTDSRGRRERLRKPGVNMGENALEVDVPWRSLPATRGRTVTLYVVTGLLDPQTRGYRQVPLGQPTATAPGGGQPGSTAVFDAGFDPDEVFSRAIGSHWGEERQSAALAGRDVSELGYTAHLSELEAGTTDAYTPAPGRFYDRIFRSAQDYGEGIVLKNPSGSNAGGSPDPQFLSPYQPYGLYVPQDYAPGTPAPLLLNGHSLDVNHNEYQAVSPNLFNQLGDERSSIVFTPLARGMDTWYIDSGFEDVLEAWADVRANYTVDDDRTHIMGYSMGGYMSYRMGLLMPDRFASAAPYVGPPAYQLWAPPANPQPPGAYTVAGHTTRIVENGLDLPFEINNGGVDELVPAVGAQEQAQTFREAGNQHLFYFYPSADHLALILADEWGHTRDWMDRFPSRNLAPAEVRYRRYPSMDLPQHGLRFDGAYWVDGMVVRSPGDACVPGTASCEAASGLVEAFTEGQGRKRSTTQPVQFVYPGPPFPATVDGTDRIPGAATPAKNSFEATFTNLSAIDFEVDRMTLDPAQRLSAKLTGDGPLTLGLQGPFPPVDAMLDGQPVAVHQVGDGIELDLALTGEHNLVVRPQ